MGYVYFFIDRLGYIGSLESIEVVFQKTKRNNYFNIKHKRNIKSSLIKPESSRIILVLSYRKKRNVKQSFLEKSRKDLYVVTRMQDNILMHEYLVKSPKL